MPGRVQSWDSIVKRYEDRCEKNEGFKPMMELVKQLAGSPYAKDIRPATSRSAIIVSPKPELNKQREVLAIDYNLEREYFILELRRQQTGKPDGQNKENWVGYCPPKKVYPVIVEFFCLQKWFVEFSK